MMNPLEFLFSSLSFLSYETEILEVCDWNYERADEVKKVLSETISCLGSSLDFNSDNDDPFLEIKIKLSKSLSEKEVETCLCILKRSLSNFDKIIIGDLYEN